jgi:FAD/FMN-containing dehydrogenase
MKPLTDYVDSLGNIAINNEVDTIDGYYDAYANYLIPNAELNGLGAALGSRLIPSSQFNGSDNQQALLDAITQISDMVTFPTRGVPDLRFSTYGAPLQFLLTAPSNYPTTAANDTSSITPTWREAVWHVFINVAFANTASASDIQTAFHTAHNATEILRKLVPDSGAYQNETDVFETDPVATFWGEENYERLLSIKKEIDPDNILTCLDCIGWNPSDERYSCYPSISQ